MDATLTDDELVFFQNYVEAVAGPDYAGYKLNHTLSKGSTEYRRVMNIGLALIVFSKTEGHDLQQQLDVEANATEARNINFFSAYADQFLSLIEKYRASADADSN